MRSKWKGFSMGSVFLIRLIILYIRLDEVIGHQNNSLLAWYFCCCVEGFDIGVVGIDNCSHSHTPMHITLYQTYSTCLASNSIMHHVAKFLLEVPEGISVIKRMDWRNQPYDSYIQLIWMHRGVEHNGRLEYESTAMGLKWGSFSLRKSMWFNNEENKHPVWNTRRNPCPFLELRWKAHWENIRRTIKMGKTGPLNGKARCGLIFLVKFCPKGPTARCSGLKWQSWYRIQGNDSECCSIY